MKTRPVLDRRQFCRAAAAAAAAGGLFISRHWRLHAAEAAIRETEHFWFRLAPEGPYIDSQRENKAFGFGGGKIFLSEDNGLTWVEYDLAEFGPRSPVRFQPKNSDGWFRVDLRKGWIERAEVLFIKPKV